ncbi:MAG: hypothetical protein H6600_03690 [Flavobacteriales bacterium]|nr:hypothetical protein [Flavobacteriales bacterium]
MAFINLFTHHFIITMNAQEFISHKKLQIAKHPYMYTKDIGGKGKHMWRIDGRSMISAKDLDMKVFTFEKLSYMGYIKKSGKKHYKNTVPEIQYRIGYFIVGKNGRWTWGQFTPMISADDLNALLKLAKEEGVLEN